jgi:hypothetical protein
MGLPAVNLRIRFTPWNRASYVRSIRFACSFSLWLRLALSSLWPELLVFFQQLKVSRSQTKLSCQNFSQKTNKWICFVCFLLFTTNKTNSFVLFLGAYKACPNYFRCVHLQLQNWERFWPHCEFLAAIFSIHLVRIWQRCLRKGTYSQSKAIESVRKKILDSSHWSQYVWDRVEHLWASEFESFLENFEMQKIKIITTNQEWFLIW